MLDKLRENPSAVVAGLVAAGVLAIAVGAGGNNDTPEDVEQSTEPTTSEVTEAVDPPAVDPEVVLDDQQEQAVEELVSDEPQEGPVVVSKEDTKLSATVRPADNQTVIVRQMVDDFATQSGQSLSAEQRLYVETNLVNTLPRSDKIFTGQVIEVEEATVADLVSESRDLTDEQKALWAQYL